MQCNHYSYSNITMAMYTNETAAATFVCALHRYLQQYHYKLLT